jgi:hypothetical protein
MLAGKALLPAPRLINFITLWALAGLIITSRLHARVCRAMTQLAAVQVHLYQLRTSFWSAAPRNTFMEFTKAFTNRERQLIKARQQLQRSALLSHRYE